MTHTLNGIAYMLAFLKEKIEHVWFQKQTGTYLINLYIHIETFVVPFSVHLHS